MTYEHIVHQEQDEVEKTSKLNTYGGNYMFCRPVRRILKRGVQSTAWPLGHGEGECAKLLHYG